MMLRILAICFCVFTGFLAFVTAIAYIEVGMTPGVGRACDLLKPRVSASAFWPGYLDYLMISRCSSVGRAFDL